jgi:hypothetical protein
MRWLAMFREIGYGLLFLLSTAFGGLIGLVANTRPRGGTAESRMWEDVTAILIGTFCGAIAWLVFRYAYLQPRKQAKSPPIFDRP